MNALFLLLEFALTKYLVQLKFYNPAPEYIPPLFSIFKSRSVGDLTLSLKLIP